MADSPPLEEKGWTVGESVLDDTGVTATVAYVGETKFADGKWIGLVYDQPVGKNNGSVKGVKYFECAENHGKFVRENKISSLDGGRRGSLVTSSSLATSQSGSTTSLHSLAESASGPSSTRSSSSSLKKPAVVRQSLGGPMKPPSSLPHLGKGDNSRLSMPAASALMKPGTPKSTPSSQAKPAVSASESKVPGISKPPAKSIPPLPATAEKSGIGKLKSPLSEMIGSPATEKVVVPIQVASTAEKPSEFRDTVHAKEQMSQERRESVKSDSDLPVSTSSPVKSNDSAELTKRLHDQEIEIKKLHFQVEKLEINKARMAEVHSELQKELDSARREAREALETGSADEMSELRDTVEMLTIDKEMAEEKRDQLANEVEDLKLKLEETTVELESLQHEVQEGGKGEASSNFHVQELQKQNDKLKNGLLQLRDMLAQEKHEKQKLEKELKVLEESNDDLNKTVKKVQTEAARNAEALAELREQVDASLGAEEMVERLTEKNLELEDKVRELLGVVDDYESMANTNNEVIELGNQESRQLREEVDMARAECSNLKMQFKDLQQTVTDSTVTIHKFRDLTRQLQNENSSLREQLQLQEAVSATSPTAPVSIDFRLKIQDEKAIAERVSHRMLDISGKMLAKKLAYLSLFMPDLYASNREEAFVQICVIPEQIGLKLSLIGEEVSQKFDLPPSVNQSLLEGSSSKRRDEVTYGLAFVFFLKVVDLWDRDIDHAIRCATPDVFSMLNELESQLQRQDDSIQYYVDLLKQSRLDEVTSLEYLETSAGQLLALVGRLAALGCDQRSRMEKLKDVMDLFTAASRVVGVVASSLKIGLKDHGPEVTKWLGDFVQRSDDISDMARRIKRPLDTDNELRAVMLPDHVQSQLRPLIESIQRVATLCYTWYRAVGHQASLQVAEKGPMDGGAVKAILYSENDRGNFYKSPSASPQQFMLNALDESLAALRQFSKEIEDGEWTRGALKAPEMPKNHPLRVRADLLKKSLADAEDLKSKIMAKDEEILEIRKNLRSKVEEVSELQLRRSLAAKKEEKAGKNEEERSAKLLVLNTDLTARLTKLQDEYEKESSHLRSQVELLESEKRHMEEKLKQTSKRFLSVDMSPGKPTGKPGPGGDQPVEGQVEVLRQVIATLRAENVAVKSEYVRRDLEEKLPPLRLPRTAKRDPRMEQIGLLSRQKAALEMERVVMFARTALDLTKPKDERGKLMKERKTLDAEYQLKLRKIELEIMELNGPGRNFFQGVVAAAS